MTTRTITLTDRPPVEIDESEWPQVAKAERTDDPQHPSQANRVWTLRVRQHADGRAIAYGAFNSNWPSDVDRRGGQMVAADGDIVATIVSVGEYLDFGRDLIDECIGDLPAVRI